MRRLDDHWYHKTPLSLLLLPLSGLYRLLILLRRQAYQQGLLRVRRVEAKVIVVGNITVGGTGKTPLVIWLVEFLKAQGFTPGIVSRGYRAKTRCFPQRVETSSDPREVGDEAVLLARRGDCPVLIDPDRARAADLLATQCNVIISDDGLQHYALGRDIEIAVVDGMRRFGNGYCLPAGPLREPLKRLHSVDLKVCNGGEPRENEFRMALHPLGIYNLQNAASIKTVGHFKDKTVHAIAGIGYPARFFNQLHLAGVNVIEHAFPDHHDFSASDLQFADDFEIVMTEKDAVKCRRYAEPHHWYMPVQAILDDAFSSRLLSLLGASPHG